MNREGRLRFSRQLTNFDLSLQLPRKAADEVYINGLRRFPHFFMLAKATFHCPPQDGRKKTYAVKEILSSRV